LLRVQVSWKHLMGRTYLIRAFGQRDALVLWRQWPYWRILFVQEFGWRDVPALWGQCLHRHHDIRMIDLDCVVSSSGTTLFHIVSWLLKRAKEAAIQLYLADLHWGCRTEHSVLHWGLKRWEVISMWWADLESELYVPMTFCIQKNAVQNTVNEPLRS
jgi:hypothetical protein